VPVVIEDMSVDVAPPPRDVVTEQQPNEPPRAQYGAEAALEAVAYLAWRQQRLVAD